MLPGLEDMEDLEEVEDRERILKVTAMYCLGQPEWLNTENRLFKTMMKDELFKNKNFSKYKQDIPSYILGYTPLDPKRGADAEYQGRLIEVKPVGVRVGKNGKIIRTCAGGTWNDVSEANVNKKKDFSVVCAVYTPEAQLVSIVEFPLIVIYDVLLDEVEAAKKKKKKRVVVSISYTKFDDDRLTVHFISKYASSFLTRGYYDMLCRRF